MDFNRATFNKSERLCSTKVISSLFENGNIFYTSLFKVVWDKSAVTLPAPAQVIFSVSKKGFKLSVTRNLIKRRIREAYRKNKRTLYEHLSSEDIQIVFVAIIKGKKVPDYLTVEKAVKEMIEKLIDYTKDKNKARSPKTEDGSI
jgi:ribonuclease P protein component